MNRYTPSFKNPDRPDSSPTQVHTPSGAMYDVADPRLAAELYPKGARVIRQNRGVFDAFPLSLITTQTIAQLGEWVGEELHPLRFRPNMLVELEENRPFIEDEWVGHVLTIGEIRMRVDKRDGRCMVISLDPETAASHPEVFKTVVGRRDGCLGVYGSVVQPGRVAVGDGVLVNV